MSNGTQAAEQFNDSVERRNDGHRGIGSVTKVDDIVAQAVQHRIERPPDRGRNMDTRTSASECRFVA